MPNNIMHPYAADVTANLYKKHGKKPFPKNALPKDLRIGILRDNNVIERCGRGTYHLTDRGVRVLRQRRLI